MTNECQNLKEQVDFTELKIDKLKKEVVDLKNKIAEHEFKDRWVKAITHCPDGKLHTWEMTQVAQKTEAPTRGYPSWAPTIITVQARCRTRDCMASIELKR